MYINYKYYQLSSFIWICCRINLNRCRLINYNIFVSGDYVGRARRTHNLVSGVYIDVIWPTRCCVIVSYQQ